MTLGNDVDLEEFITAKDDLSGADIKAVCTEAGLLALRERRMRVTKSDFSAAREKVRHPGSRPPPHAHDSCRSYTGRTRAYRMAYICNFLLFPYATHFFLHALFEWRTTGYRSPLEGGLSPSPEISTGRRASPSFPHQSGPTYCTNVSHYVC
jgi:hypothetical protein